jgi:hypothetical protein
VPATRETTFFQLRVRRPSSMEFQNPSGLPSGELSAGRTRFSYSHCVRGRHPASHALEEVEPSPLRRNKLAFAPSPLKRTELPLLELLRLCLYRRAESVPWQSPLKRA